MVQVDSEAMTDVAYDPRRRILRIHFRDGEWYRYFAVSETIAQELLTAESKGRYFHEHILGRYAYERE